MYIFNQFLKVQNLISINMFNDFQIKQMKQMKQMNVSFNLETIV